MGLPVLMIAWFLTMKPTEHKYEVRFARGDPETPPTKDEQIAIAHEAARKLGIPNVESKRPYRIGRNSHTGEVWACVECTWEGLRKLGLKLARSP